MALIGAITGAVSLINGINQNNAANARMREAERQQKEALAAQKAYVDRLLASYQEADASGQFNSYAREQQLKDLFKNALDTNLKSTNTSLYNSGFRPGDSAYAVQDKNIAEKNALGLAGGIMDTRDQANRLRQSALQATNPGSYTSLLKDVGDTNYKRAQDSQVDLSGTISSLANNPVFKIRS